MLARWREGKSIHLAGVRGGPYLGDDVFELALLPGVRGVAHHGDDGVVELLVLVVQEDQLGPQVCLLGRPQHLGDVDAGPEELQVLPHLLGLELGVEDGQLGEHAHVGALQAQRRLQQGDQLLEVAPVLVVADELLQLVSVDHDVQAADLGQPELLAVHARKAHLGRHQAGRLLFLEEGTDLHWLNQAPKDNKGEILLGDEFFS